MRSLFQICFTLTILVAFSHQQNDYCSRQRLSQHEVVAEWKEIRYTPDVELEDFQPRNNILTGLKVWGPNEIYATVSRWLPGVPSALNKIVPDEEGEGGYLFQPYPSIEMQEIGEKGYGHQRPCVQPMLNWVDR